LEISSGSYFLLKNSSGVSFGNCPESFTFLYLNSKKSLKKSEGEKSPTMPCSILSSLIRLKPSTSKFFISSTPVNSAILSLGIFA